MSDDNNYDEFKQLGSMSIHVYVVFCFIFFLVKDNLFSNEDGTSSFAWIFVYIGIFFVILFLLNMSIFSNELVCGNSQPGQAFFNTLYPMTFIFVVVAMLLEAFPGWVRVFSNTFGMSAARLFGIKKILADIFNETRKQKVLSKVNFNNTNSEDAQSKLLFMNTVDMIYNDPVPIINEMDTRKSTRVINEGTDQESTISVWDSWELLKSKKLFSNLDSEKQMNGGTLATNSNLSNNASFSNRNSITVNNAPNLLNAPPENEGHQGQQNTSDVVQNTSANSQPNKDFSPQTELEKLESQLFEIIKFKENVGYFVWYLLVGLITTIASTNIVLSENCAVSKSMVDQAYKDFTESVKQTPSS